MLWVAYQQRYLADRASQRAVVKSRRIGFTEVCGFRKACRASGLDPVTFEHRRPVDVNIISAGMEQSKDFLRRMAIHLKAIGKAYPSGNIIENETATILKLTNGKFVRAYSSNPRTIRSYGGDVVLDEYGAMPRAKEVWAAANPLARPTLGNPEGYEIDVIGTPEGDDNMFYEMCRGRMAKSFRQFTVTVYDAVKDGFPLTVTNEDGERVEGTIEDLMEEIGDPDIFEQEYNCCFLSASMRYISAEMYDRAVYYPEDAPTQDAIDRDATLYAGMDVARTKHASVIGLGHRIGDVTWEHDTQRERGMAWDDQEEWVDRVMRMGVRRMPIDATGLGSQFAERLAKRYPGQVEPVGFTAQVKEDLATGLKLAIERSRFRPKAENTELRRDVLALRRIHTSAGNVRYDAPQDKRGHADGAWAWALNLHGQASTVATPKLYTLPGGAETRMRRPVGRSRRPV